MGEAQKKPKKHLSVADGEDPMPDFLNFSKLNTLGGELCRIMAVFVANSKVFLKAILPGESRTRFRGPGTV